MTKYDTAISLLKAVRETRYFNQNEDHSLYELLEAQAAYLEYIATAEIEIKTDILRLYKSVHKKDFMQSLESYHLSELQMHHRDLFIREFLDNGKSFQFEDETNKAIKKSTNK